EVAVLAREIPSRRFELPVLRLAGRREREPAEGRIRIDDRRMRPVAMEVGALEEEAPAEALIPGDGLHDALGRLERAVHHVHERHGRSERAAVRGEPADRLRLVLRERADVEGRALVELSDAAPENAAAVGKETE